MYKAYWWSLSGGRKWMCRYHRTSSHVDRRVFRSIIGDFNNAVIRGRVIDKGIAFKIPRFGEMVFRKYKPKVWYDKNGTLRKDRLPIDWEKTWAMWFSDNPGKTKKEIEDVPGRKVLYNMNTHSDGYRFKFFWFKGKCMVVNNTAYVFRLKRGHNRYLAQRAKDPSNGIDWPRTRQTV